MKFQLLLVLVLLGLSMAKARRGKGNKPSSDDGTSTDDTSSDDTSSDDTSSDDTSSDDSGTTYSTYAQTVNALIDAGTCASISASDACEDAADAESHYETYEYGGYRVIITSGSPNHAAEENTGILIDGGKLNPNRRCSLWQYALLPLNPTKVGYADSGLGTVGYVESGGVIFNHLSSPTGDLAIYNEIDTLDSCFGHSNDKFQYHYHGIPKCVPEDTYLADDANECYHLGYMLDGFPVFGRCAVNGIELDSCYVLSDGEDGDVFSDYYFDQDAYDAGICLLDQANGYTFQDGTYGYILTESFSTTPTGYYGSVSSSKQCGFTP